MHCHCGKPLHYDSPQVQNIIQEQVDKHGEFMRVRVGERVWLVQRHYVALHGLIAEDLPKLGFQEITALGETRG